MPVKWNPPNEDNIVGRYRGGETGQALARSFNISRPTLNRFLVRRGVGIRGHGDARRLMWQKMSLLEREERVRAAHDASRGRKMTRQTLERKAQTVQANGKATPTEARLRAMLAERGVLVIPQMAVGPYNCDLGTDTVAVECWGGHWHFSGSHARRTPERIRYLMDRGRDVLMVVVTKDWPLTAAVADYVATFANRSRCHPSRRCEYRVIRGGGNVMASGSANDDEVSIVPTFTRGRNVKGQYCRVARQA